MRLRVGPGSLKGIWVDGANLEIQKALESMEWIGELENLGYLVELGQKHKTARRQMEPQAWLPSYNTNGAALPLLSTIASFSQPGPEANRAMISAGFDLLWDAPEELDLTKTWVEFGAGVGNLSAAYSSFFEGPGLCLESDPRMFELLQTNQERFFPRSQVKLCRAEDFDPLFLGEKSSLWLLDPPRSGFPDLLAKLLSNPEASPHAILVYHCHEKGLKADVPVLKKAGYQLHDWSLIDIFPGTPHAEVLSLFVAR
jgi:tRNA/tmRNA/rRNA uracil-C5-methylase (TrmA/RlmC/RlmD family)